MRRPTNLLTATMAPTEKSVAAPEGVRRPGNYLDLYGLSKPPFGGAPDHAGYILFGSNQRVFNALVDHVANGFGAALLQGIEGIGKTETICAVAAVAREAGHRVALAMRPANGRTSLPLLVGALLGQPNGSETDPDDAIGHFLAPPRKVLLADDIDLMPPDCLSLLLALAERLPNEPGSSAIVMTTGIGAPVDPTGPALSRLVALAGKNFRMLPLGPSDARQYIERSLWMAGGATRRLITPSALKLIIARCGGVPSNINRLMEAAFTAGFARSDPAITARTVTAAIGPITPRPAYKSDAPPGVAGRVVQVAAVGLLFVGVAVFLYKGTHSPLPPPATGKPSSVTVLPAPTAAKAPSAQPSNGLSPDLVTALMKRGEQALALGDVAAARLLFQRAADAGNAGAFIALGKTYDPNYVAHGVRPDPARAVAWYRKALALQDTHASDLLKRLGAR